jgi:DNA-directed RNA polymerase subunit RPC12/RpoP
MSEIWKPIYNIPDPLYEISNYGRIRSHKVIPHTVTPHFLNANPSRVHLWINGKGTTRRIARMVLETFLEPSQKRKIEYINGNETDNRLSNLRWETQSKTYKRLEKIIKTYNFNCLSSKVYNPKITTNNGTYEWKPITLHCSQGHTFQKLLPNIYKKDGIQCPVCSKKIQMDKRINKISKKLKPMICLEYLEGKNYKFKCKNNHVFIRAYNFNKITCPYCNFENIRIKIKKFLKKHHIEFLSGTYDGMLKKYNFKCRCGYTWIEPYTNLLQRFKKSNYICKQCKKLKLL